MCGLDVLVARNTVGHVALDVLAARNTVRHVGLDAPVCTQHGFCHMHSEGWTCCPGRAGCPKHGGTCCLGHVGCTNFVFFYMRPEGGPCCRGRTGWPKHVKACCIEPSLLRNERHPSPRLNRVSSMIKILRSDSADQRRLTF